MIKRLIQLIMNALRRRSPIQDRRKRERRLRNRRNRSKRNRPKSEPFLSSTRDSHSDPNYITYTIPRSEVVTALNRTLRQFPAGPAHRSTLSLPNLSTRSSNFARGGTRQSLIAANAGFVEHTGATNTDIAPFPLKGIIDVAYLCERQGRLAEAERLYRQAITLSKRIFGPQHLAIAPRLNELASLYCRKQQYAQAMPLLTQVLRIRKQHQIPTHGDIGETLCKLAVVHWHLGQYRQAESFFQQALTIFGETLGELHPRTKAIHTQLVEMLTFVIESGYFEHHFCDLPPLDLERLSEIYSWAKPDWIRPVSANPPTNDYSWIKLSQLEGASAPEVQASLETHSLEAHEPENDRPDAYGSEA
ncbi:MAG: tetratricopeptide repeat protein [Cyanobacteria bacterium J06634_6]